MDWKKEWKALALMAGLFFFFFYLPAGSARFDRAVLESLYLAKNYAKEHVVLCLLPAFFIAGGISVFISQASVTKYLGAGANKVLSYGVASVSGSILAVCSCTVLPLFAGIYRMGAGLGPAVAFLYSGPAINVMAILLTARVLGLELGLARALGAVFFSLIIGLSMHLIFRGGELDKPVMQAAAAELEVTRPLWKNAVYFGAMVAILIFANWGKPVDISGDWGTIYALKWQITAVFSVVLAVILVAWIGLSRRGIVSGGLTVAALALLFPHSPTLSFGAGIIALSVVTSRDTGEGGRWFSSSWGFAKQIVPLLFIGVLVAGALFGRPRHEGLVPSTWVSQAVGGNSLRANLFASAAGSLMYFATLTEVPILEGLIGNGMGRGPALAMLLAGPAVSLPNMLVIRSVLGTGKTLVYLMLVIVISSVTGKIFGIFIG
ncbi:MAG: permease [Gemmatimonadota bacterium]|nr:permease [Gemmatimonadota bacterium]